MKYYMVFLKSSAERFLSEKTGLSDSDLIALIKRIIGLSEEKIYELRKKN
jgi:hypothetical protein